jgi:hypothetical protein
LSTIDRYGGLSFAERHSFDESLQEASSSILSRKEQLNSFANKLSEAIQENYAFSFDAASNVSLPALFDEIRSVVAQLVTQKVVKVRTLQSFRCSQFQKLYMTD